MRRFAAMFALDTVLITLRLLREHHIHTLRTDNGYRPFRLATFILGIMLGPREMFGFLLKLATANGYMSTRIADRPELGWTFHTNIELGRQRAASLPPDTIVPAIDKLPFNAWTPTEHMVFWVWVIVVLSKLGATFYHFKEDLAGSTGCQKEHTMARQLGMKVVTCP